MRRPGRARPGFRDVFRGRPGAPLALEALDEREDGMSAIWEICEGDALERLRELPDGSVQCCVTSPPYFGLRDYGTGEWEGGEGGCQSAPTGVLERSGVVNPAVASVIEGHGGGDVLATETSNQDVVGVRVGAAKEVRRHAGEA